MSRNNNLAEGFFSNNSDQASEQKQKASAFVYIVTKIFPLLATGVFASLTDVKKPETIALSGAMVASTALPIASDVFTFSEHRAKLVETLSSFCMVAGVGMMDQGTFEEHFSWKSAIAMIAVGCFSMFALLNTLYSGMKLGGCIEGRKPGVEFTSSIFGFVGSALFLTGNTLALLDMQKAGKAIDAPARMIAVAGLFTLTTLAHMVMARKAMNAMQTEQRSDRATNNASDEVVTVTSERPMGTRAASDTTSSAGNNSVNNFLAVPVPTTSSSSFNSMENQRGSNSPTGSSIMSPLNPDQLTSHRF